LHPRRVGRNRLVQPPELIRQAEQERSPRVEAVPGRSSGQLRWSATEPEAAAGAEVVAGTEFRLGVIQPLKINVRAEPQIVLAFHPGHVGDRLVLVVTPD